MSIDFRPALRFDRAAIGRIVIEQHPAGDEEVLNLSNTNAARVLGYLGVSIDWDYPCGSMNAKEFASKALAARDAAIALDDMYAANRLDDFYFLGMWAASKPGCFVDWC